VQPQSAPLGELGVAESRSKVFWSAYPGYACRKSANRIYRTSASPRPDDLNLFGGCSWLLVRRRSGEIKRDLPNTLTIVRGEHANASASSGIVEPSFRNWTIASLDQNGSWHGPRSRAISRPSAGARSRTTASTAAWRPGSPARAALASARYFRIEVRLRFST
jgi:hypothetical protein